MQLMGAVFSPRILHFSNAKLNRPFQCGQDAQRRALSMPLKSK
jgi:hypothetical protein